MVIYSDQLNEEYLREYTDTTQVFTEIINEVKVM